MIDLLERALKHGNVIAGLYVIAKGETHETHEDSYRALFGWHPKRNPGRIFTSFADHPRIRTYETHDEFIRDGDNSDYTTAAGRWQATETTWGDFLRAVGPMDFSPHSQELFAVWCIRRRGALDDLIAGRFEDFIRKCRKEWASLPGAGYGQPEQAISEARDVYLKWGGHLSAAPVEPPVDTLATEHYGEAVTESVINPIPSPEAQEENMAPIIAAILPTLINAAPDLIRLFGKGDQSERNAVVAEKVGALAVQVTGAANEQAAAKVLSSNPVKAQEFRAAVADNFDAWMGMAVKFHGIEEESRQKARQSADAQSGDWKKLVFSLPFVGIVLFIPTIWAVVAAATFEFPWLLKMDAQLRGTVIGFVLGTIAAGIVGYIYGASMTKTPPTPQQPQR
jgi:muramidase (phage lysozyme)